MRIGTRVGSIVLLLCFCVTGVGGAAEKVLWSENFESVAPSSMPAKWGTRGNNAAIMKQFTVVEDPAISAGKVLLQQAGTTAGDGYLLMPAISAESSQVIIRFRVRWQPTEARANNAGFYIYAEGAPWPPYASMFWGGEKGEVSVYGEFDGKLQSRNAMTVQPGSFHQFELDVDLDESKFYLTVDGERWADPLFFRAPGTSFLPFQMALYWKNDKPAIYWDDFVVIEKE